MMGVQGSPGTDNTAVTTVTTQSPTTGAMTTQPPTTEAMTTQPLTVPSERCGGSGWRKVAFIDMTNTSQNCPQGLTLTGYSKQSCGRTNLNWRACSSVIAFPVGGGQYSRVCGRAKAYHWGSLNSFDGYNRDSRGINEQYVDSLEYPPQPKSLSLVKLTYKLCSAQSAKSSGLHAHKHSDKATSHRMLGTEHTQRAISDSVSIKARS